jgi:hypothetical protein
MTSWFASLSLAAKIGVAVGIGVGSGAVVAGAVVAGVTLSATKYDCLETDESGRKCAAVKGGRFKSLDDCRCIGAVVDESGKCACGFAPDAAKTYNNMDACFADADAQCGWTYKCDAASTSPSRCARKAATDGFPDEASCRCVAPQGGEPLPDDPATLGGPLCQCVGISPSLTAGEAPRALFSTVDECFKNEQYKCGWKYKLPEC